MKTIISLGAEDVYWWRQADRRAGEVAGRVWIDNRLPVAVVIVENRRAERVGGAEERALGSGVAEVAVSVASTFAR